MPWAPDYIEPEELADFVHTDVETDRVELVSAISSASRAIDDATHRQFGSVPAEARIYTPRWSTSSGMWVIHCDDFASITKIELDTAGDGTFATEVPVSSGVFMPHNATAIGRVYERVGLRSTVAAVTTLGKGSARLTASWGWPAYPNTIVTGTKLQASRFFARRNSPYGVAGSPDQGSEIRLLAKADPDVILAVRPFKRRVWLS